MADTPPHQHEHITSRARTIGIASAIWAGSILVSRIMGLVREQVIGRGNGWGIEPAAPERELRGVWEHVHVAIAGACWYLEIDRCLDGWRRSGPRTP